MNTNIHPNNVPLNKSRLHFTVFNIIQRNTVSIIMVKRNYSNSKF
ncbi:hypothetical protein DI53_1774 [Sphingobacterium deserti]|uniref:Uncharacterized protein n=1 Tax=Sphingobacterium deserti TaxID=1229276 RepID=A0A0B8T9Q4_9SPHI|nr:hypothetical protein DI53_1774 [Sphingobacterium deserti]